MKGMRKIVIRADDGETKEYLIPRGKHISVHEGDRVQGGRGADGRLAEPARLPGRARRPGAAALPRERGAGGLPPAGRDHQRQAHRDHRAPDAPARADRGGRRHRVRGRASWWTSSSSRRRTTRRSPRASGRPPPSRCCSASPRRRCRTDSFISAASFQETTRVLTEAAISGKIGRPARAQGERHRGPAHPGRHRAQRLHAGRGAEPGGRGGRPRSRCVADGRPRTRPMPVGRGRRRSPRPG